uniref:Family with sequence similarity 222 member A n=1 Tax=Gasterosteus aculeatus aculeatus TaxID=481459 RepID=A0AAQ4S2Q6_GASAC|nr:protein FAM222A [Gasterosteus aculeatus aculeatus]XP_040053208.1 protein FAM222A [Gasterosteus aculeatus aculeatus]XP_040053209.1 protein FAM222A [Gasterosteus aculeatus aculeatus]XP_040053211.1 protein FAM222A [Gasterosteus aculeatus aculeatus]XP_040053212.1 protein FAM222A [Gasterosteus aculeatus aculeatus]
MLACIQRRQNLSLQNLACVPKSLDVPPPPLLLSVPPLQPCAHKGKPAPMISRYPSPAELDAFAQRTAKSPLSIKIFQSEVRVPQHKQLNKTVNGLDTTGQHHSPYSHQHSGGHRGLLAVIKASVAVKGVVKSCEGRRTKHASAHATLLPYDNPLNNSYAARHGHKAYHTSSCKPRDVPVEALCASREPSLAPQSELAEVQSLMRQMSRVPHSQAPQLGGEARASPSLQAVAAVAHSDSDFGPGVPPQSGLAFTGAAVLPTQSADVAKAGYLEKGDYAMWQHKHQIQQQPYQQGAVRMYSLSNRESPGTCLPLPCSSSQLPYRPHREPDGGSALKREFSVGQYYAPLWDGVVAAPHSDRYASQVLEAAAAAGTRASRLGDLGLPLPHPRLHAGHRHHFAPPARRQPQLHPPVPPPHARPYGTDQNPCCGAPGSSVCHAAVLGSGSSSCLQSLECLISEIQPPCIKERMLGRGYEAMGMPQLLEHQQQAHIQLPVYR